MELSNRKISSYVENDKLIMEDVIKDYTNYVYTIIRNTYNVLSKEDIEEVVLDVFLTLWKNQYKLNINKSISAYISGITRNLIKYKYRQIKPIANIEDYEEKLFDFTDIELISSQKEKEKIIFDKLELMKKEDKEIFIEYYYGGKNIKKISNMFQMSESKVKSKLYRVRKKLSKVLRERGYSSDE